jgi:hypothetical protein
VNAVENRAHDLERLFVRFRDLLNAPQPPRGGSVFCFVKLLHIGSPWIW